MANDIVAQDVVAQIRDVVIRYGHLAVDEASLGEHDDLFRAGMGSHANVNVMLAMEARFGIEFPETMLRRSTFQTIATMRDAVCSLIDEAPLP